MTGTRALAEGIFEHPEFDSHEQIIAFHDRGSGVRAIIAIHDTRLGPAMGGTRMWPYASSVEALTDVLRLSRGMTYKNAVAGIDFGGGKAVIIGDPARQKSPALLRAYARRVDSLRGLFITGEDVGMGQEDIEIIADHTAHVRGTRAGLGDPSPYTALGVVSGIRAAVAAALGRSELAGLRISIQGLGHVGMNLARRLAQAGARLIVSDLRAAAVGRAMREFQACAVEPHAAHAVECDVFAPCALGGVLNEKSIAEIRAPIVAGSANNQLATPKDGARLAARGILYAPDYVINAGGVISIALGRSAADAAAVRKHALGIGKTLAEIFRRAEESGRPTAEIADQIAEERLSAAGERRLSA